MVSPSVSLPPAASEGQGISRWRWSSPKRLAAAPPAQLSSRLCSSARVSYAGVSYARSWSRQHVAASKGKGLAEELLDYAVSQSLPPGPTDCAEDKPQMAGPKMRRWYGQKDNAERRPREVRCGGRPSGRKRPNLEGAGDQPASQGGGRPKGMKDISHLSPHRRAEQGGGSKRQEKEAEGGARCRV